MAEGYSDSAYLLILIFFCYIEDVFVLLPGGSHGKSRDEAPERFN